MAEAFGGWPDAEAMLRQRNAVARLRHTPRLLTKAWLGLPLRPAEEQFRAQRIRLYQAIAAVADADVVIDTTRRPPDLALLLAPSPTLPAPPTIGVQLVRDPRAVAYSDHHRNKRTPEGMTIGAHGPATCSLHWVSWNLASEVLVRRTDGLLLRYEDAVRDPAGSLERILRRAHYPAPLPSELLEGTVPCPNDHVLAGNPIRALRRPVRLHLDDEWRRAQPRWERLLVSALTAPLSWRYGYRWVTSVT